MEWEIHTSLLSWLSSVQPPHGGPKAQYAYVCVCDTYSLETDSSGEGI